MFAQHKSIFIHDFNKQSLQVIARKLEPTNAYEITK